MNPSPGLIVGIIGLLLGFAVQLVTVAIAYGKLIARVDALKDDLNGLGRKLEQRLKVQP